MLDSSLLDSLRAEGHSLICGVDEAGRGPLCGPVFLGKQLDGTMRSRDIIKPG